MQSATAVASPNIALIKYWGNKDPVLHIPSNSSLSMNLTGLQTRTQVTFEPRLSLDQLVLNGKPVSGPIYKRVSAFLDRIRILAGFPTHALVVSENNFPMGAGIASSASAFAALALASSRAAGLNLSERDLSRLARTGSGSACRSIPGGFVEWQAGSTDVDSYAFSIAPADHWDLCDCIAIISQTHKPTGSQEGHSLADTSPLQPARVADTPRRMALARMAIQERDFEALASVVEQDSNMMHAVMLTSQPILFYWQPATLQIMQAVTAWREEGLPVFYTIDAGPNVHVFCNHTDAEQVTSRLNQIPAVERVIQAGPGGPAHLVDPLTEGFSTID